ncbi:MAG: translation initiation factor IF-3 [Puniceicoccales bacterium]|jgi:translation initiation factor IF-3|nr:translation initiation factor IF-3 [Puniceicoccales bacterium]
MINQQFNPASAKKGNYPSDRKFGNSGKNFTRKNEKIRAKVIRVIDSNGQQLGIMQTMEAISIARSEGLDLVEISPNANPPICKILDFGKYKYNEKKNKTSSKQVSTKIKEVKLHVAIESNDYNTKMRHAIEFLEHGNKLKLSLMFRGRELTHPELGFDLIKRFIGDIKPYGTQDYEPKLFGKIISVSLSPCIKKGSKSDGEVKQQSGTSAKILDVSELLKLK